MDSDQIDLRQEEQYTCYGYVGKDYFLIIII